MTTLDQEQNYIDPSGVPMMPTALRYGLIGGLILIGLGLILNLTGMGPASGSSALTNLVNFVAIGAIVYMALVKHRDEDLGGFISYGRCIGLGILTCLVLGVISGIFSYIYMTFIDPGIIDVALEAAREQYENMGMDEAQIETSMEWVKTFMSPGWMVIMAIFGYAIMGLIASLIIGAIVKKDNPVMR